MIGPDGSDTRAVIDENGIYEGLKMTAGEISFVGEIKI